MDAADEFVAGEGADLVPGEGDGVVVEGLEDGAVAGGAAIKESGELGGEGEVVRVEGEADEVELSVGDLGGELDAGHAGEANGGALVEEVVDAFGAVVVGEGHDVEPGGLAGAGEFAGRQAAVAGGGVGVQVDHGTAFLIGCRRGGRLGVAHGGLLA